MGMVIMSKRELRLEDRDRRGYAGEVEPVMEE
jgi:hypothetical protein